jgi:hypothetical protein
MKRWHALGHSADQLVNLFRTVFEDVALSPYTRFVDTTLAFLDCLEQHGHWSAAQHADLLCGLLRQLVRHLTAFDLVTFHHRGANYPDALLLDAALQALLAIAQCRQDLFLASAPDDEAVTRVRRRAVRQACLLRLWYEGHPVPDLPTSPGENSRVLPPEFPRVPEEQITDPTKRHKRLFDADPLLSKLSEVQHELLCNSLRDLEHPSELRELGVALFLDRPLGVRKRPGEPDATPLLSYEAYSATIAKQRLEYLEKRLSALAAPGDWAAWRRRLAALKVGGLALQPSPGKARPGVVSLMDAFRVAPDFVLLRTTRRSIREYLASEEFRAIATGLRLDVPDAERVGLIVAGSAIGKSPSLFICDAALESQCEMELFPQEAPGRH